MILFYTLMGFSSYPSKAKMVGTSSIFRVTRPYETPFSGTRIQHDVRSRMINLAIFLEGFFMLGFDLTPDMSADEPHNSFLCQGNVRIEARFKLVLTELVTYILFTEYPGNTVRLCLTRGVRS
jgi:hypothetical protein